MKRCTACSWHFLDDETLDEFCPECGALLEHWPPDDQTIDDGFGSEWSIWCPMCGKDSMVVARPGHAQCMYCG